MLLRPAEGEFQIQQYVFNGTHESTEPLNVWQKKSSVCLILLFSCFNVNNIVNIIFSYCLNVSNSSLFYKTWKEEKPPSYFSHITHMSCLGLPSVHPNATWHFRTVLIFQYYDQRLVMQAAWIMSVHSAEAWLSETSPVLWACGELADPKTPLARWYPMN